MFVWYGLGSKLSLVPCRGGFYIPIVRIPYQGSAPLEGSNLRRRQDGPLSTLQCRRLTITAITVESTSSECHQPSVLQAHYSIILQLLQHGDTDVNQAFLIGERSFFWGESHAFLIPGSSRYVEFLPKLVGFFWVNFSRHFTHKRKIQLYFCFQVATAICLPRSISLSGLQSWKLAQGKRDRNQMNFLATKLLSDRLDARATSLLVNGKANLSFRCGWTKTSKDKGCCCKCFIAGAISVPKCLKEVIGSWRW